MGFWQLPEISVTRWDQYSFLMISVMLMPKRSSTITTSPRVIKKGETALDAAKRKDKTKLVKLLRTKQNIACVYALIFPILVGDSCGARIL